MKKIIIFAMLLCVISTLSWAANFSPSMDPRNPMNRFNPRSMRPARTVITGYVDSVHVTAKACILNVVQEDKTKVGVIISAKNFSKFPAAPQDIYLNKNVKVTGMMRAMPGRRTMFVNSPKQIVVQ